MICSDLDGIATPYNRTFKLDHLLQLLNCPAALSSAKTKQAVANKMKSIMSVSVVSPQYC